MVEKIILSGIILIPFYELLVKFLPYSATTTGDTREAKSFLALLLAIACFFLAKNIRHLSKFIPILIVYIFFTHHLWYKMPLVMNDTNIDGFYRWRPMLQIIAFYGLFAAVASSNISVRNFMKFYMWSAFAMAIYVLLQTFGLEQFFLKIDAGYTDAIGAACRRVGNLGQPTLVAPFIAAAIPAAFYFKKHFVWIILAIAVWLTESDIARGAMILGALFYLFKTNRKLAYFFIILAEIVVLFGFSNNLKMPAMSGRELVWPETINDVVTSPFENNTNDKFVFTGIGLGTYPFAFHIKHKHPAPFMQAHNEYLEWFYSTGLFGLIILTVCLYELFKVSRNDLLLSTFVILALCAGGTFLWQLGVYQFLTTIIVGLIYGGKNEEDFRFAY